MGFSSNAHITTTRENRRLQGSPGKRLRSRRDHLQHKGGSSGHADSRRPPRDYRAIARAAARARWGSLLPGLALVAATVMLARWLS